MTLDLQIRERDSVESCQPSSLGGPALLPLRTNHLPSYIRHHYGEGNGTPLQYSCLQNSMDRGAWWAAIRGVAKSQTRLHFHFSLSCIGEGNGNPLQCSCLENPRDVGAWWAAISGVAQSRTRLKRLSSSSSSLLTRWEADSLISTRFLHDRVSGILNLTTQAVSEDDRARTRVSTPELLAPLDST